VYFYRWYADDVANWDMPDELKKQMKDRLCAIVRVYTCGIYDMTYEDFVRSFELVDRLFRQDFKRIPRAEAKKVSLLFRLIFAAYGIIGIVNTAKLAYFYLHRIKRI
jgi:hypothetical protein